MVLVCFLLDLCGLSSPLLTNLKQSLLQLANFYAISSPSRHRSVSLRDRIGLCYTFKNRISSSFELKVAYNPGGNFSLRDFHHAVNNLPDDAFLPELNDSGTPSSHDVNLLSVLSDQVLYRWGGKDIERKVIVLSSCLPRELDSAMKQTLMDAAEKCVSVEFLLIVQSSSYLSNQHEHISYFVRSLSDLDNCSFQTYLPEGRVFQRLVKRWLQDLKDDMEEPLQVHFIFKTNLLSSLNQISCSLSISSRPIVDGFTSCKTCRCHGALLENAEKKNVEGPSCPITGCDLKTSDVIENSVQVGETTILYMPSFQSPMKLQKVSSPIEFNIIERTSLNSVSEGVLIGPSYFVAPSACQEVETSSDEIDQLELNAQVFKGICNALYEMDQGLVCTSYCNVETMRKATFQCYYILLPSNKGPLLLRRLAGLEEVFPTPDVNQFTDSSVPTNIQNLVEATLLKMEVRDYDPVLHERGFHQKLNLLIRESLQFGSIPPKLNESTSEPNSNHSNSSSELIARSNSAADPIIVEETPQVDHAAIEDKTAACIAKEWEQLVVNEIPKLSSPTCISKPKVDQLFAFSPDGNKQLDVKTSRILERLEMPRQLKEKITSPIISGSSIPDTFVQMKRPLVPFQPSQSTDQNFSSSQLMRPSFHRSKRKCK